MKDKLLRFFVGVIMIGLLLSACSSEAPVAKSEKESLTPLTLMLDWYPNAVHSGIYLAEEKGYFADEGLELTILMPSDANDPLKLAAANKIDIASSYQTQLLLSRSEGLPIKAIASNVQRPLDQLMVKATAKIESPKDLEGKTVGYSSSAVREAVVKAMVKNDGGDPSQVSFVDVGFDLIPALATDRVAAIMGGYINHELPLLEQEGYAIKQFKKEDYGVPTSQELIFVVGEETLQEKKEALTGFLRALTKGQQDLVAAPEKGLKLLLAQANADSPLDPAIEKQSLAVLLPLMGSTKEPFGYQSEAQYQTLISWLQANELLTNEVTAQEAFVTLLD